MTFLRRVLLLVAYTCWVAGAILCAVWALSGCTPQGPAYTLPSGRCSAVSVTPDQALTAGHCVRQSIAWDPGRDLALIRAEGATQTYVPVARAAIDGEAVSSCSTVHNWCSTGHVLREGVGWYELDLTVIPGWSGSPVIAASDGALVGVITACSGTEVWAGEHKKKTCRPGWSIAAKVTP